MADATLTYTTMAGVFVALIAFLFGTRARRRLREYAESQHTTMANEQWRNCQNIKTNNGKCVLARFGSAETQFFYGKYDETYDQYWISIIRTMYGRRHNAF